MKTDTELPLPGVELTAGKMPGHWLLARLGKRVLRPGGLELTRFMLSSLGIRHSDGKKWSAVLVAYLVGHLQVFAGGNR